MLVRKNPATPNNFSVAIIVILFCSSVVVKIGKDELTCYMGVDLLRHGTISWPNSYSADKVLFTESSVLFNKLTGLYPFELLWFGSTRNGGGSRKSDRKWEIFNLGKRNEILRVDNRATQNRKQSSKKKPLSGDLISHCWFLSCFLRFI